MTIGLPPGLVHRAFPFHLVVDRDGLLQQVGPSLARLCDRAVVGGHVDDVVTGTSPRGLRLHGPDRVDTGLVLLVVPTSGPELLLRGEVVQDGDWLWFLGSPWLTELSALGSLGLTLADFAAHDPITDLLLLLQAQRSAQADVEELLARVQASAAEQARASEQERRLASELRALPDLALRVAADGTLLAVRPARDGEMAATGDELVGRSTYEAFPWLSADLPGALDRALHDGRVQQLSARTDRGDAVHHYEVRVVRTETDQALVLVRDVSEVRAMQEQLQHRAFHDPLTGLANRSLFADRVEHALAGMVRAGTSPTLLLLDLDGFKHVNDVHGHLVGDAVLSAVSQRLAGTVRPQDTVARLGGDEFAVLLDDGGATEGELLARRLLERVGLPVRADDIVASVSASIGIVCARPGDDLVSLLRHGDTALYAAKAAGKARWVTYDAAMRQRAHDRSTLESDLQLALDDAQLGLEYQPIRDLRTGAVYGWEALLRWRHPELGLLAPEVLLPLAEETGRMGELTGYVLRRAAADAGRLGGLMHVNLSPSMLVEPGLVRTVADVLRAERLPGPQLVLELVEAALMSDQEEDAADAMHQLRELDVGMSLDDFGTGFSSLSRLHALPFTELKLDRSFLSSLQVDGRDAVAQAVLGLGEALGLTVVAEGIESQTQAERLSAMGCRYGQGFYLGRPTAAPA